MYQSFIIMLSPSNVVFLLFKRYSMPSPSDPPPTREEEKLAARLSLILHQMASPFFVPFLQYPWKKGGYIDACPPFMTPVEKCFPSSLSEIDCDQCDSLSFIACARCNQTLCWKHYVLDFHYC